jgi:tetratricopeptide (TPR) repeat protein/tRNA A-37 threonylcarbamoyl transferase component Bud32
MTPDTFTTLPRDASLGQCSELLAKVLDEYLISIERGQAVSPEELLARHPEMADELRGYLSGLQKLHPEIALESRYETWLGASLDVRPLNGELGDFRFVREIGRGGMGVVYEAIQISLGRRVALKVLPCSSAVDEKRIARFKNEAQAAAQVDHPHIVPVFAIGQERGVHYFAMQLIGGQSLDQVIHGWRESAAGEYAAAPSVGSRSPSAELQDRLRLITRLGIEAAEALHAAHEFGVVHRDIKPSNLLIDEKQKLWITDFGVARCKTQTNLTETGGVVGTLRYMSPEQARGQAALVDQRTDVYSLGVTLYELATLRQPFEEVADTALATESALATLRLPRYWNPSLPIDFENIVLKAMADVRQERYATARELAEDLARFQEGRPIHARRPSAGARLTKWALRHRRAVAAATGFLALGVVGLAISLAVVSAERAKKEAALRVATANQELAEKSFQQAEAKFRQAREVLDRFGARVNQGLATEVPGAEAVRKQLLAEMLPYYREFASEAADDPTLQADLALTYTKIAELSEQLGSLDDAREAYQNALTIFEKLSQRRTAAAGDFQNLARCLNNLAQVSQKSGEVDEARQRLERALTIQKRLAADFASSVVYRSDVATSHNNLGLLLSQGGDQLRAAEQFYEAIAIHKSILDSAPEDEVHLRSLAGSYNNLSALFIDSEPATARQLLDQALALQLQLVQKLPHKRGYQTDLALTYNNLGTVYARLTDWGQSEQCFGDATTIQKRLVAVAPLVASYRRDLAVSYNNLGMTQSSGGQLPAAEESFDKALAIQEQLLSTHSRDIGLQSALAGIHNNLGTLHQRQHRWSDARAAFERAIAIQRQAVDQAPGVKNYRESLSKHYSNYARLVTALGRPAEAATHLRERLRLWPNDPQQSLAAAQDLAVVCKLLPQGAARDRYVGELRSAMDAAQQAGWTPLPDLTLSPFDVLATERSDVVTSVPQVSSGKGSDRNSNVQ